MTANSRMRSSTASSLF